MPTKASHLPTQRLAPHPQGHDIRTTPSRAVAAIAAAVLAGTLATAANAATDAEFQCGSLANAFGPFDYRTAAPDQKHLVDGAHFTREVEQLVRGKTTNIPGPDIDYTLRAFPNHPRALHSMMELGFRNKTERPPGSRWTVACYFERALRFRPDDAKVKAVYAIYLQRSGKVDAAIKQLEDLRPDHPDDANLHYNLGLFYLERSNFDKALENAHKAYALGFPLEGLRNRLKKAGKWQEPAKEEKPAPAAQ